MIMERMNTAESAADLIKVEVAYALPERQKIIALNVPAGTTALAAARLSGIADLFEGLDLDQSPMGVFGRAVDADKHVLAPGDRVEIYRPLLIDPKESRKARAAKVKAGKMAKA
jgi:putative ubiquitin-RnfH superfamily antitoxin RatB of RatAB toxin-antitoxin module